MVPELGSRVLSTKSMRPWMAKLGWSCSLISTGLAKWRELGRVPATAWFWYFRYSDSAP